MSYTNPEPGSGRGIKVAAVGFILLILSAIGYVVSQSASTPVPTAPATAIEAAK